jgi:hypothetical protein
LTFSRRIQLLEERADEPKPPRLVLEEELLLDEELELEKVLDEDELKARLVTPPGERIASMARVLGRGRPSPRLEP